MLQLMKLKSISIRSSDVSEFLFAILIGQNYQSLTNQNFEYINISAVNSNTSEILI